MGDLRWRDVIVALVVLVLLAVSVLGFVGCVNIAPAASDPGVSVAGITHLSNLSIVGDLDVGDDATVADQLVVYGGFALASLAYGSVGSTITVAMNGYITPTALIQPLTASAAVGTDKLAAGSAGQLLVLYNADSNTITITDTTGLNLAGNWAAGQYDSIVLVSNGSAWIELARSDN